MSRVKKFYSLLLIIVFMLSISSCKGKSDTDHTPSTDGHNPASTSVDSDISKLRKVIEKEPANLNTLIKLGNLLMDSERFKEAITVYERVLELDPKKVDIRIDLGTCYRNSGDPERAAQEYRKALSYDPDHIYAHRNLGIVLAYDLGKAKEAITELETYLKLFPDAPDAKQVKEAIKELRERTET